MEVKLARWQGQSYDRYVQVEQLLLLVEVRVIESLASDYQILYYQTVYKVSIKYCTCIYWN